MAISENIKEDKIYDVIRPLRLIEKDGYDEAAVVRLLYTISNRIEDNYREFKIPKKSGGFRTIAEPSRMLKAIQRNILNNYLYDIEISPYVKSYIKNVSLKDNANVHVGKKKILKLDIESFFDHVDFMKVYHSVFGPDKFPKPVGVLLTNLTTYYGSVPQGAPTSAYISNIVMRDFDYEVGEFCQNANIEYTRYSDDMTFSGDFDPKDVIRFIRKALLKRGFSLNEDKTRVIGRSQAQVVTGISVNESMRAQKRYRKKIRQSMYYIKKYGLESHLSHIGYEKDPDSYLRSLYGKVCFAHYIDQNDRELCGYLKYLKDNYNF